MGSASVPRESLFSLVEVSAMSSLQGFDTVCYTVCWATGTASRLYRTCSIIPIGSVLGTWPKLVYLLKIRLVECVLFYV